MEALKICLPLDVLLLEVEHLAAADVKERFGQTFSQKDPQGQYVRLRCMSYTYPDGYNAGPGRLSRRIYGKHQLEILTRLTRPTIAANEQQFDGLAKALHGNRVGLGTVLPEVMLSALQAHPVFDPNPEQTRYVSFRPLDGKHEKSQVEFVLMVRLNMSLNQDLIHFDGTGAAPPGPRASWLKEKPERQGVGGMPAR